MSKMIKCKSCGEEISKQAKACPKCGAPNKKKVGCLASIGIGFGVLVLLGIIGGLSEDGEGVSSSSSSESAESKAQPTYNINDVVKVGHMEWTITDVRTSTRFAADYSEVTVGSDETILVLVFGKITNRSNDEDATLGNLHLVDASGAKYGEHEESSFVADPLAFDSFNPNVPKSFSTIFEVPRSAKGLCFLASDFGVWSSMTAKINLGLDKE